MKKYFPYIVIIILLAGAATWFLLSQTSGTLREKEGSFAVKDGKEISKIVLTDTEKNRIELTNANGVWVVNQGTFRCGYTCYFPFSGAQSCA